MIIHTANILGIFSDPFEFAGDYGPEINPIRQKVFELVVSTKADQDRGPTFEELVPQELMAALKEKLNDDEIISYLEKHSKDKIFYFFRNCPKEFLRLDKVLRDKAAREGKPFDLPILSSTQELRGDLKRNLLDAVFTPEILALAKKIENHAELKPFCSPAGQLFFYWAYHALNLHLVEGMIEQINKVKEIFLHTLGDPEARALRLKEKLLAAGSGVLFTQESDKTLMRTLEHDYLPVDQQNGKDGTLVFLRKEIWESYQIISIEGYPGYQEGVMSVLLATKKESQEKFLLASCHGRSTDAADGRLQVKLVKEKFDELVKEHADLQLLIGIDANTKSEEEVQELKTLLENLGLVGTDVGPTTVKQRMVTAQHAKSGHKACDQEDFLITLKGGRYRFVRPTVGFKEGRADPERPLPNYENPSDHYPVGATFIY